MPDTNPTSNHPNQLELHQVLVRLEDQLAPDQKQWLFNCMNAVLNEVNFLVNTIFWRFFSRGKRRCRLLEVKAELERAAGKAGEKTQRKRWLGDGQRLVKKNLDCLGSLFFIKCLQAYFAEHPGQSAHFNECLKGRFQIFYEKPDRFLQEIETLVHWRHYMQHPTQQNKKKFDRKQAMETLCYLVHPTFWGWLKARVRVLSKGRDFEDGVDQAFMKVQARRRARIKCERKFFSARYMTRKVQRRHRTRDCQQFMQTWEDRRRRLKSRLKLQNFIYSAVRMNLADVEAWIKPHTSGLRGKLSFEELEAVYVLLTQIDLLLWVYVAQLPQNIHANYAGVKPLRNSLAHNEKVITDPSRCLKQEFQVVMGAWRTFGRPGREKANDFYTQVERTLKKNNHGVDSATGKTMRYQKDNAWDRDKLEKRKLLRRVAASIKRDLKAAVKSRTA